jgi:prepilin-type N-terminal cleavage/methylation domain-containing protein
MKTSTLIRCQRAFTLLEIIVALIAVGVVAGMMVPFLGTAVIRSTETVISAQQHAYLNQVMENITADFKKRSATEVNPLENLKNQIGAEGSDVTNTLYGTYHVVTNHYITFPSGSSVTEMTDSSGNILKVTISYQGYTLTALFTK